MPKPHVRELSKNEWISEETWRLVNERVSARRGTGVQARIWRLGHAIRVSIKGERKRRVEITGEEVETLLGEAYSSKYYWGCISPSSKWM